METNRKISRKSRNTLILIILLIPIILGDIALILQGKLPFLEAGLPMIVTFVVFIALALLTKHKDGQIIEHDERNERIEGRAFTYSWLLSIYVVLILMLNDNLGFIKTTTSQILFFILVTMLVTYLVFRVTLGQKGDIEN